MIAAAFEGECVSNIRKIPVEWKEIERPNRFNSFSPHLRRCNDEMNKEESKKGENLPDKRIVKGLH